MKKIWRYNRVTGYWVYQRSCAPGTEDAWMTIFRKGEPEAAFKLSSNKPSPNHKPS